MRYGSFAGLVLWMSAFDLKRTMRRMFDRGEQGGK